MQMILTDSFQVSQTKAIPQNFHHCFILSSIHSFRKKLLNINSIPDTLLGTDSTLTCIKKGTELTELSAYYMCACERVYLI